MYGPLYREKHELQEEYEMRVSEIEVQGHFINYWKKYQFGHDVLFETCVKTSNGYQGSNLKITRVLPEGIP